ncbi:MAG: M16 family metallopeptidase [Fidelibacterota bacterium]
MFQNNTLKKLVIIFSLLAFAVGKQTPFKINYEKLTLENGLQVILHKDKSDPIVSVAILYHVGSNREVPGRTGFAHLFEHMLFQESQHVGQDQFFKKIQNAGGTLNGGTWKDGTVYYEVVPKNALEMVLWLESDRMGWLLSTVTQEAFINQQEVVQNEKRQRVDNRPYGHTNYVVRKNLYPAEHPYNWTTIGELKDLQNATLKNVQDFHQQWYGPNNATLVVAGDFSRSQTLKWIKKYFGEIKPGPEVTNPLQQHVKLKGIKRVYHEDNFAKSPELNMVFPTVDAQHEDAPALELLAQLLGDGKKAPLYKVIVEAKKLAPSVRTYSGTEEITGTFEIVVRTFPEVNLTDVEQAIHQALTKFEQDGFSADDLKRIKAKYESGFYRGISSVLGKSFQLSMYNVFYGSPDYLTEDLERTLNVTEEDIMRVYNTYLKEKPYVLTSFVPKNNVNLVAKDSREFPVYEEPVRREETKTVSTMEAITVPEIQSAFDRSIEPPFGQDPFLNIPKIWRHDLAQGVPIYGIKQSELPLVNFAVTLKGGLLLDNPDKIGVANLMSDIMMEGTATKTPVELEEAIDALGSSIYMYTTDESIVLEASTLKSKFAETLALAEEILFEPRWDDKEFERIKRETVERINRSNANPSAIASKVFKKLNYGDHIKANPIVGTVSSVRSITMDDLKAFYADNFTSSVAYITIVGDIAKRNAVRAFKPLTERWVNKNVAVKSYSLPEPVNRSQIYFVDVPGAKQSEIRIGYLALPYLDPDYFPATVMNVKLGGNFNGVVNMVLREEKGYTYGARTRFSGSAIPGLFTASSAVRTNTTEESVKIFRDLMAAYRNPITDEDLKFTKNVLLKSNARRFETLGALRGLLDAIAKYNLPFDYIKDQERIIQNMTVESHNALARKYINPDQMVYLVVGDAKTQLEGLKSLGFGDPILLDDSGNPVKP